MRAAITTIFDNDVNRDDSDNVSIGDDAGSEGHDNSSGIDNDDDTGDEYEDDNGGDDDDDSEDYTFDEIVNNPTTLLCMAINVGGLKSKMNFPSFVKFVQSFDVVIITEGEYSTPLCPN